MVRHILLAIAFLAAGWISMPTLARSADATELKIISEAHESLLEAGIGPVRLNDEGGVVIRSAEELVATSTQAGAAKDAAIQKQIEAEVAKLLSVDAIDWNKQMVLGVRGKSGTKLDRVQIESIKAEGKVLTVAWKLKQRPPHAGPGTPVSLILVDRFDDEVKFVEAGRQ